jgi:hypothetical protein
MKKSDPGRAHHGAVPSLSCAISLSASRCAKSLVFMFPSKIFYIFPSVLVRECVLMKSYLFSFVWFEEHLVPWRFRIGQLLINYLFWR